MLKYIKEQIKEKTYMTLSEAVSEKISDGDDEVRDMFLDDPEAMMIGAEDDPEIEKMVNALPDEMPETMEVGEKDIAKIKESFSLLEGDLADEFTSDDMYENDDEDIYDSSYQKVATEDSDDIEELFEDIENILEGEQADAYKTRKEKEAKERQYHETKKALHKGSKYYNLDTKEMTPRAKELDNKTKHMNASASYKERAMKDRNGDKDTRLRNFRDSAHALDATDRWVRRHGNKKPVTASAGLDFLEDVFEDYEIDEIMDEATYDAEMSPEDNYENEGESIYASDVHKLATENFDDIDSLEEDFDEIDDILEGKLGDAAKAAKKKAKKFGKDMKKKLPFGKKEGSEDIDVDDEDDDDDFDFDF